MASLILHLLIRRKCYKMSHVENGLMMQKAPLLRGKLLFNHSSCWRPKFDDGRPKKKRKIDSFLNCFPCIFFFSWNVFCGRAVNLTHFVRKWIGPVPGQSTRIKKWLAYDFPQGQKSTYSVTRLMRFRSRFFTALIETRFICFFFFLPLFFLDFFLPFFLLGVNGPEI